jgi:acetoacetyl-CoA synthetase
MLGMAIESFSTTGKLNPPEEEGELVCLKPFPCMPIGFWPLPGYGISDNVTAAQRRFQQSYFAEYEGVWCKYIMSSSYEFEFDGIYKDHGDHVIVTRSKSGNAGGLIMLGRSDGVL